MIYCYYQKKQSRMQLNHTYSHSCYTITLHCNIHYLFPPPLATLLDDSITSAIEFQPLPPCSQSYNTWLADWVSHLSNIPSSILVPPKAANITTPLKHSRWQLYLLNHPDTALIKFFVNGITQGFRLGFNSPLSSLTSAQRNLGGALQHPDVVEEYIAEEINQHRVIGPLPKAAVPKAHISRFGVIPKRHTPNKWRLIVDLSHPPGRSVNDGIPKTLCSLSYVTVDTAIQYILQMGPGALLAKMDIKHAFRLLPVHPADRHLLAMSWKGNNSSTPAFHLGYDLLPNYSMS